MIGVGPGRWLDGNEANAIQRPLPHRGNAVPCETEQGRNGGVNVTLISLPPHPLRHDINPSEGVYHQGDSDVFRPFF